MTHAKLAAKGRERIGTRARQRGVQLRLLIRMDKFRGAFPHDVGRSVPQHALDPGAVVKNGAATVQNGDDRERALDNGADAGLASRKRAGRLHGPPAAPPRRGPSATRRTGALSRPPGFFPPYRQATPYRPGKAAALACIPARPVKRARSCPGPPGRTIGNSCLAISDSPVAGCGQNAVSVDAHGEGKP